MDYQKHYNLLINRANERKPSGMKGKVAWNKGVVSRNKGKKMTDEQLKNSRWVRYKIKCEYCNLEIGINNIKKHKKIKHGHN